MKIDNSTADGIINQTVKLKREKSFTMQFWWLVDQNDPFPESHHKQSETSIHNMEKVKAQSLCKVVSKSYKRRIPRNHTFLTQAVY